MAGGPISRSTAEPGAMADGSTAWCVGQNSGVSRVSAYLPEQGAREVFGSPDAILSWGNGPATAHPVDGGYIVNCKLAFSSGMHQATWLGCQDLDVYDAQGNIVSEKRGETKRGICFFPAAVAEVTQCVGAVEHPEHLALHEGPGDLVVPVPLVLEGVLVLDRRHVKPEEHLLGPALRTLLDDRRLLHALGPLGVGGEVADDLHHLGG